MKPLFILLTIGVLLSNTDQIFAQQDSSRYCKVWKSIPNGDLERITIRISKNSDALQAALKIGDNIIVTDNILIGNSGIALVFGEQRLTVTGEITKNGVLITRFEQFEKVKEISFQSMSNREIGKTL
ncbi:MAG: hypothetical protein RLO81_00520 [Fulvivirga sp.]|uniref:hypothetical protein n=1 Tax=Fulvivirga sp. TaxID=1931237 RepID=UPI0032ED9F62